MINVVVMGGTHGNELTGIQIVNYLKRNSSLGKDFNINIIPMLGNYKAIESGTRYADKDLNRSFENFDRNDVADNSYESRRAIDIYDGLREVNCDLLIDLHTTTSNMGKCIVMNKTDSLSVSCISHLKSKFPELKVIEASKTNEDSPFVGSIAKSSFLVEIGAIANGVVSSKIFNETKELLMETLNFLKNVNLEELRSKDKPIDFPRYKIFEYLYFPCDERGEIKAFVHPDIEGKDFQEISDGMPLFLCPDENGGESVTFHKGKSFYPVFINEAAYLNDRIALMKASLI